MFQTIKGRLRSLADGFIVGAMKKDLKNLKDRNTRLDLELYRQLWLQKRFIKLTSTAYWLSLYDREKGTVSYMSYEAALALLKVAWN